MDDLGYKNDVAMATPPSEEKKEEKVSYPTLNIYKNVPKFLAEKDVGYTCRLEIIAKVVSKSERSDGNSDITLEIQKIGDKGKAGKKTKEEYLAMNGKEREEYDKEDKDIKDEE
jgi:hypothetical protein